MEKVAQQILGLFGCRARADGYPDLALVALLTLLPLDLRRQANGTANWARVRYLALPFTSLSTIPTGFSVYDTGIHPNHSLVR